MIRSRIAGFMSFGLGILSLFAVFVSHLALTDIYHGEADLSFEWGAVQICFAVIIAFQVSALLTLRQVLRSSPQRGERTPT